MRMALDVPGRDLELEQLVPEVSWDDYVRLEVPEGLRFEFDEGRLLVSPSGTLAHNALVSVLMELFGGYEEESEGAVCTSVAMLSFYMPPEQRDFQPDVGVLLRGSVAAPLPARIERAPDIAIEVLSPSTARRDRGIKAQRYFQEGTREYWLWDPEARSAEFYRRGAQGWEPAPVDRGSYRTPLLPGFELPLAGVWRRLDRKLGR